MRAYISSSIIGVFAYNEEGEPLDSILFEKDSKKIAEGLKISEKLSVEEEKLVDKLKNYELVFEQKKENYDYILPNVAGIKLRENLVDVALKNKFVKTSEELRELIYAVNFELTKQNIKQSITSDKLIIHAVYTIDELDKVLNALSIRLREWYSLYYPELSTEISDHEKFVKSIEKTKRIQDGMGSDLEDRDILQLKKLASGINELYIKREGLETYIKIRIKEIMPNTENLLGPMLTARLLAMVGGLEKLSKLPSSTIQVIGAEKALFRFLRGVGTPPKFGILYASPYIQQASKENKGKVSRILASKVSIAVKIDYYGKGFQGDKLKKEFEERIKGFKK